MWWTIIVLILISTPVGAFDKWDRTDYTLLAMSTAVMAIDWRQTRRIAEEPKRFYEMNPILPRHPDHNQVDLYFAASWLIKVGIAHVLPSDYRKIWLGAMAVGTLGIVIHNNNIGLGLRW